MVLAVLIGSHRAIERVVRIGVQIDEISIDSAKFNLIATSITFTVLFNPFGSVFGVDFRTFSAIGVRLPIVGVLSVENKK